MRTRQDDKYNTSYYIKIDFQKDNRIPQVPLFHTSGLLFIHYRAKQIWKNLFYPNLSCFSSADQAPLFYFSFSTFLFFPSPNKWAPPCCSLHLIVRTVPLPPQRIHHHCPLAHHNNSASTSTYGKVGNFLKFRHCYGMCATIPTGGISMQNFFSSISPSFLHMKSKITNMAISLFQLFAIS